MNIKKATGGDPTGAAPIAETDFDALATWAETADIDASATITKAAGPGAGIDLLETALGSSTASTL